MKQWYNSVNWWKVINITFIIYVAITSYAGPTIAWCIFHAIMGGVTVWAFMQLGINSHIRDEELKAKNDTNT